MKEKETKAFDEVIIATRLARAKAAGIKDAERLFDVKQLNPENQPKPVLEKDDEGMGGM